MEELKKQQEALTMEYGRHCMKLGDLVTQYEDLEENITSTKNQIAKIKRDSKLLMRKLKPEAQSADSTGLVNPEEPPPAA